jgi:hypothetical protein
MARQTLALSLFQRGWTNPDVAGAIVVAIHPFDDEAPPRSRSYEDFVRTRSIQVAMGVQPPASEEDAVPGALAALSEYRRRAIEMAEPYYATRYDAQIEVLTAFAAS